MKNVYIEIQCEFGTFKTNVIQISDEDYVKWILCENLDFIPKLIKNE